MSLSAGRLRHRVHIQEATNEQDPEAGELIPTWSTVYSNVYCAIEPLSVKDFIQSRAVQSEVTARVIVRKSSNQTLTDSMRLLGACGCHAGKIYNPAGWFEDMESGSEYLTAPCSQGVNEG